MKSQQRSTFSGTQVHLVAGKATHKTQKAELKAHKKEVCGYKEVA